MNFQIIYLEGYKQNGISAENVRNKAEKYKSLKPIWSFGRGIKQVTSILNLAHLRFMIGNEAWNSTNVIYLVCMHGICIHDCKLHSTYYPNYSRKANLSIEN